MMKDPAQQITNSVSIHKDKEQKNNDNLIWADKRGTEYKCKNASQFSMYIVIIIILSSFFIAVKIYAQ